jgi:hypothetical protein
MCDPFESGGIGKSSTYFGIILGAAAARRFVAHVAEYQ